MAIQRHEIHNNFTGDSKNILVSIGEDFIPADTYERLHDFGQVKAREFVQPFSDLETVRYVGEENYTVEFRFFDNNNTSATYNTYQTSYETAGFNIVEIENRRNAFKRSFFRLSFFDSIDQTSNNLLLTEYIDVDGDTPVFEGVLNRIYWLRYDEIYQTGNDRFLYATAQFFNAKTGIIHKFISIPEIKTSPVTFDEFRVNKSWRFSGFRIINPSNNNELLNFSTITGGGNLVDKIVFSELVIAP